MLALVEQGLRNRQIAERLFLSAKTVDHHVGAILRKLGVHTRGEAGAAARRLGVGCRGATERLHDGPARRRSVTLGPMIRRLPHVDRVGIEERAAWLGKRSIKTSAKLQGIRLAVSMVDLTTLEGAGHAGKVRQLAAKAVCPAPDDARDPERRRRLRLPGAGRRSSTPRSQGTGVHTAAVATGFPSGQTSLDDQAARDRGGGRRRRRRDRHGHLARGVPLRRRRARAGGDRARARRRAATRT